MSLQNDQIDVGDNGDIRVLWHYPNIYENRPPVSYITIDLEHVRAADGLRIWYSSARNGWVIEQASIFEWASEDADYDEDWQEVAFVQAWARKDARGGSEGD